MALRWTEGWFISWANVWASKAADFTERQKHGSTRGGHSSKTGQQGKEARQGNRKTSESAYLLGGYILRKDKCKHRWCSSSRNSERASPSGHIHPPPCDHSPKSHQTVTTINTNKTERVTTWTSCYWSRPVGPSPVAITIASPTPPRAHQTLESGQ